MKCLVFGAAGVSSSDDDITFNHRLQKAEDLWRETCPDPQHVKYFTKRLTPMLKTNFKTMKELPWVAELGDWTNNNCESFNHILKNSTEWQKQPLSTLVRTLKQVTIEFL